MKKNKIAKDIKGRIKQINYKLRYWKRFFGDVPDFTLARKRRTLIKEPLLTERNELIATLRAYKKHSEYATL